MPDDLKHAYAWLITDADGNDNVPAYQHDGVWMPLIGTKATAIASTKTHSLAQGIAKQAGRPIRLVRWNGPAETLVRIDANGDIQK